MINNNELMKQHFEDRSYKYDRVFIDRCVDTKDSSLYLTPNEVASYLGCTAQTVRKWIKLEKLGCTKYKVGLRSYIGITGKDLSEFVDATGYVIFRE